MVDTTSFSKNKSKILIIAVHPDDETLGAGGTILKHKANGHSVYWLIVTNIYTDEGYSKTRVEERQREIDSVAKKYKFQDVYKLDLPTTKLDMIPIGQLIESIGNIVGKVKPDIVYLPNKNDVHTDHRITFNATMSSIKTFRSLYIKRVLMYEVISETEFSPPFQSNTFTPNSFSDISVYMEEKIAIMKLYKGELSEHPFPRSAANIKPPSTKVVSNVLCGLE